jgi:hypothetical protein
MTIGLRLGAVGGAGLRPVGAHVLQDTGMVRRRGLTGEPWVPSCWIKAAAK